MTARHDEDLAAGTTTSAARTPVFREPAYAATLPARLADGADYLNTLLGDLLSSGMYFEWQPEPSQFARHRLATWASAAKPE